MEQVFGGNKVGGVVWAVAGWSGVGKGGVIFFGYPYVFIFYFCFKLFEFIFIVDVFYRKIIS